MTGWTAQEELSIRRLGTCTRGHPRAERRIQASAAVHMEVYCPRCEQSGLMGLAVRETHVHEFAAPYFQRGRSGWVSVVDPCPCGLVWGEHLRESLKRGEDVRFAGGEVRFVSEASSCAKGLTRTDFVRLAYQTTLDKARRDRDWWRDAALWTYVFLAGAGTASGIGRLVTGRQERRQDDDGRFRP